ncbi:hypothetical protein L3Q82_022981 [Scortum barcoo]|uniref:Uncharacterized protein n=1 Tax=Scortum barcoo TaxID=214431 RepID=A0ACB8WXY5_9TELE|nr:hypothetical protein L3Q82_022981 [Scortum barcoo]
MFQQPIKNFNITFNVYNERSTFTSGDLITGHVSFDLTKETRITSISMVLEGKARVHWSSGGGGGGRRNSGRRHFSAKLDLFRLRTAVMQQNSGTRGLAAGATAKLPPGTHVYPFACQLPRGDFPSSFRGVHGQISYTLTLGISRPWHMSKDFVTELNYVKRIDTNQPELWSPLSGSNNMTLCCLWCASGPITLTAGAEKKAFMPGETAKIICDFSNASSRVVTPKVKLLQKQVFYTHNKVNKRIVFKVLASETALPVAAHTSGVHTQILLTIPPSAPLTVSNCSILDVEYSIEVSLTVRAFPDLTVLIPVILCDTPVFRHQTHLIRGEGIQVVIQNQSSRGNKPKYCLYEKHSYFSDGEREVETKDVLKEVGDTIPPSASQTVTKIITIPPTTRVSILNCDSVKVEHRLKVHLEVTKECHIDALLVKFKGKAEVKWSERHSKKFIVYQDKEKYFSMKGYFIRDKGFRGGDKQTFLMNQNGETCEYFIQLCLSLCLTVSYFFSDSSVVAPGCHVYPFTFQFPLKPLPSSFSSHVGTIVYSMEARLKRSMNMDLTYSTQLNFASKPDMMGDHWITTPQHGFDDNQVKRFNSEGICIDVKFEKNGFFQGEGLKVQANVQNSLSREVNPKYRIYRKNSFFANGKRKVESKDLLKEVGEPIPPSTNEKITRVINIPHDMEPSIVNCNIIRVEHILMVSVHVGVKHAFDPEVKFPIVILPVTSGPKGANTDMPGETSFLQNPTASGPSALHPSYTTIRTMSSTVKNFKVTYNPLNKKNTFTNGDTVSGQVHLEGVSRVVRSMSRTVKSLKVSYDPVNEKNTFTHGDAVSGRVHLEVAKECHMDALLVKFKGKAEVMWTERHGKTTVVYHSKEKYFSVKHYFAGNKKRDDSSVVAPGCHVYPFTFQFPFQPLPSSFSSHVGKIVYSLEARLKRSMRIDQKDSAKISFESKTGLNGDLGLMTPQHESKDKKMKFFNSGTVAMDVNLEKTGFFQGEGLKVLACIQNNSSREIKPKYCIYRKYSFFAKGKRRVDTKDLLKEVGEPIPPSANEKITRVINIPHDMEPSILNCNIIKVEHRLRALKSLVKEDMYVLFPLRFLMDGALFSQEPRRGSKDKSVKVFGSGRVSVDVHTKRMGYQQGKPVKVVVEVSNHSTRAVKPKFIMYEKKSFFAQGHRRVCTNEILKEKIEAILSSGKDTVTKVITIPEELPPSILNCSIIKLEYRLKVTLDLKHLGNQTKQPGGMTPQQQAAPRALDPPPPYGAYAMYPSFTDPGINGSAMKTGSSRFACFSKQRQAASHSLSFFSALRFPLCIFVWRMTINTFSIEYDAINSKNIFTNGDTINGRITVEVSKETKIQSLVFIAKGKAKVCWTEHYGQDNTHVYWADEKYYDIKHHILRNTRQDASIGRVVHKLKAELRQSMKLTKKTKTHFTFVSKADMDIPRLMEPQCGSKDKSVKVFGSGRVSVDVHIKRMGYQQGNNLVCEPAKSVKVVLEVSNHTTRAVKPKIILYKKKSFFAQGHRNVSTKELLKEKIEAIPSSSTVTLTKVITIPEELPPSILNCSIIKLEYRLKVHLDIKYATDPEIKLPIVVLPATEVAAKKQPAPSGDFGFEAFGNPNQAAGGTTPQQQAAPGALDPPPPYGAYAMYPSLTDSGINGSAMVTVVTSKETKVQCFLVKAKGKAKVTWCEQGRQGTEVYSNKKKYFYFEHIILQDKNKGDGSEIIGPGRNVYPFTILIPNIDMPSSYEGKWGKITYTLRAQLTQSIWLVHKTKTEFPFLTKSEFPFASKSEMIIIGLKEQQHATSISFYGSKKVTINVTTEKMGVKQGEAMGVSVEVLNDSARTVTPKFYLCEKQTFAAQSKRTVHTNDTLFATGDPVPAETSWSMTKVLSIPPQLPPTFLNCCMMNLEYRLKVTLDVPLARNPEIKLPLVILLGTPKAHQQKPKRSIWFRKLPG